MKSLTVFTILLIAALLVLMLFDLYSLKNNPAGGVPVSKADQEAKAGIIHPQNKSFLVIDEFPPF